jgi:hypothetical protein
VGVLQPEGSSRRARATVGGRESWRRGLVRRRRRDLGPSRAQADGFAQTVEELRFTVVMPPTPGPTQLEEMRAPALGESAPLVRDLLECVGRQPCRHGEAVGARSSRPGGRVAMARRSNDGRTMGCARAAHPNHERMIIRFEPVREGKPARSASAWGKLGRSGDRGGPKTDPPGRGNPTPTIPPSSELVRNSRRFQSVGS